MPDFTPGTRWLLRQDGRSESSFVIPPQFEANPTLTIVDAANALEARMEDVTTNARPRERLVEVQIVRVIDLSAERTVTRTDTGP